MNLVLVIDLLSMLHVVVKFNLGQDSEARFGQDFEAQVLWRGWCLVEILKLMLGRDSEDEIWSRFVFELVIWTQPSGPLCLWQCFCTQSLFLLDRFSPLVCTLVRECLYLSLALHRYYKKVLTEKNMWSQNHLILTEVKINGANEDMIVAACEQFGDKSDEEVTKKETCK